MPNYVLLEKGSHSRLSTEIFTAPDDETALQRVYDAMGESAFELWRGEILIRRQAAVGGDAPLRTLGLTASHH